MTEKWTVDCIGREEKDGTFSVQLIIGGMPSEECCNDMGLWLRKIFMEHIDEIATLDSADALREAVTRLQ